MIALRWSVTSSCIPKINFPCLMDKIFIACSWTLFIILVYCAYQKSFFCDKDPKPSKYDLLQSLREYSKDSCDSSFTDTLFLTMWAFPVWIGFRAEVYNGNIYKLVFKVILGGDKRKVFKTFQEAYLNLFFYLVTAVSFLNEIHSRSPLRTIMRTGMPLICSNILILY